MFFGTNIEHAKALNRRGVFDTVRQHGPLTRADVTRLTGLSQQSVSNIVNELEVAGLVRAEGRRQGGRGQPGIELSVNPCGGYSIGLHLSHRRLTALLVDLNGTVLQQARRLLPAPHPSLYGPIIVAAVDELVEQAGIRRDRIWGLGCVMPGLIERGALTVTSPPVMQQWENFPIERWLEDLLGLPVMVENDAIAAAIGEQLYGVGRDVGSFFYIHFGLGVGGGMVLGGQSYRGSRGRAGRLGHLIVKPGGRPCNCGNRGCLEQYVSLYAMCEAVGGPERTSDLIDPAELLRRHEAGDTRLAAWTDEAAEYLRYAIHTIENLFDPDTIVLGGEMPTAILDTLLGKVSPLLPLLNRPELPDTSRVQRSAIEADMPALGATALPITKVIQPDLRLIWETPARDGSAEDGQKARPVFGATLTGLFSAA